VVTLLDQTPTFEWNMARLVDRNAQLKKHAYLSWLNSFNTFERAYVVT
jgi:hypothetical protein